MSLAFIYSYWVALAIYNLADWLLLSGLFNSSTTSLFCSLQLVLRDLVLLAGCFTSFQLIFMNYVALRYNTFTLEQLES